MKLKKLSDSDLFKKPSESLFQTLIENSSDAILVVQDSKIVYANKVTTSLCGYEKPEELIGENAMGFISTKFREHYSKRLQSRIAGTPQPERFDHEIVRKDGQIVQVETTASLVEYNGKTAVLYIGRDITERKRFESKLFALHRYAAQLGAAQTLVEISEPTLNAVTAVMGFDLANFFIREEDRLGCVYNVGFNSPYWNISITDNFGISRAVRDTRTIIVDDVEMGIADHLAQQGVQSELATPVFVKGKAEAVISVESKKVGVFSDNDVQILEIIAKHAGSALERIDLG